MAPKGYCIPGDVADFMGIAFTAAQEVLAEKLIEQAEAMVDIETARAWLTGALTDEAYYRQNFRLGNLYLRYAPVASVTTVKGRSGLGVAETTLTVDVDYEVRDLSDGLIWLVYPSSYDRIRVTYTPVATVPGPIARATAELVGAWMQPSLRPETYGLASYSLPDLSVQFAREMADRSIPPTVQSILDLYRYPVHA